MVRDGDKRVGWGQPRSSTGINAGNAAIKNGGLKPPFFARFGSEIQINSKLWPAPIIGVGPVVIAVVAMLVAAASVAMAVTMSIIAPGALGTP